MLLTHLASCSKCIQHVATCPQHCRVGEFVTRLPAPEQTHIPTPSPAGSGGHPRGIPPCMWAWGVTFSSLHTGQKDGGKQAATPAASSTVTDNSKRPWEAFSVPLWPHLAPLPTAPAAGARRPPAKQGGREGSSVRSANSPACTGSCWLLRGGTVALVPVFVCK